MVSGPASVALANLLASRGEPNPAIPKNGLRNVHELRVDDKHAAKALEASLNRVDEPPAYTEGAIRQPADSLQGAGKPAPTLDTDIGVASLPILQTRDAAIERDILTLDAAITPYRLGQRGAKCKANRARKQLVRDLWAMEEAKYGGCCNMSCREKKVLKAQIKAVKRAVKVEIKAAREC